MQYGTWILGVLHPQGQLSVDPSSPVHIHPRIHPPGTNPLQIPRALQLPKYLPPFTIIIDLQPEQ